MIPLATSAFVVILIAWAIFLALVVAALAAISRHRREHGEPATDGADRRLGVDRRSGSDRRNGPGDRRIGLPDLRARPLERRNGPTDRRRGSERRSGRDRRGPQDRRQRLRIA